MADYRLLTPHNPDEDYHDWCYLPGFVRRGIDTEPLPATIRRDRAGRTREFAWRRWLVVVCNNTKCPAKAIVHESVLLDAVSAALPCPKEDSDA